MTPAAWRAPPGRCAGWCPGDPGGGGRHLPSEKGRVSSEAEVKKGRVSSEAEGVATNPGLQPIRGS
eukprot:1194353-Prorocentrum_minimum.AAC.3